jgi:autotransporter-associated beta strand protein
MLRNQRTRRLLGGGSFFMRRAPLSGFTAAAAAAGLGILTIVPAEAQSIPASVFQTYNAANAGSIAAGPFSLFTVPVDQLLPTQMNEGLTEVDAKTTGFDLLSPSQLQTDLLGDIEPVVIGPGGVLYLTDGHHTFTALEDSKYGASDPTVYVNVIANFSNLTTAQFWAAMESDDLLLPLNDGVPQTVNLNTGSPIPTSLQGLNEDVYRGLEYNILKNNNNVLFPSTSNLTGQNGSSVPGLDKETGLYADFINADAYRNANGGLGLPYLSPADVQISTLWNLNANSVTSEPNVGTVTVGQLPGFILAANGSLTVSSTISNSTLSGGTLAANGTFTGITQFNLGTPSNPILVGNPQSGFVMQLGNDLGGTVTLSGTNTYTGGTTITAGDLIIASDASLGAAPPLSTSAFNASLTLNSVGFPTNVLKAVEADNGIIFNSLTEGNGTLTIGTATGQFTSSSPFVTNRPIAVDSEAATINVNDNVVRLNGPLVSAGTNDVALGNADGEAPLTIDDLSANGGKTATAGTLILSTPSPYFYGDIIIGNVGTPTVEVMSDAALGNTTGPSSEIGEIELNGGTLQTDASFSAPERNITLAGGSQIDVDGNTTTWGTLTDVKRTIAIVNSNTTTAGSITFNNFNVSETATLQLDGKANGTTYAGAETVTFTNGIVRTGNATLFVDPSSATSLGSSQTVFSSGASTALKGSTAATGNPGIAPVWIIGDTEANGANAYDFLTYNGTNGYVAATYKTALDSGSAGNDVVELPASATTVSTSESAYALKILNKGSVTINSGQTLTIGDGTDPAGLILSGSSSNNTSIQGGTLAFGGSEAIIYTRSTDMIGSGANIVIGSLISSTITGSGGMTLAGAGALTLSTAEPGLSGLITIDSGELNLTAANVFASDVAGLTLGDVKSSPSNSILNFTESQTFSTLNTTDSGTKSAITFNNGATLTIGDSNNLSSTLGSSITETGAAVSGAITKNGTGLLDLSGMSSGALTLVSGSTIDVNAGELRVEAGSFANPTGISVAGGAELQFSEGIGGAVFAGDVSGAGVFHLVGGTLQLTGTNTYTGGTVLEVGTTLDVTTANLPNNAVISNAGGTLLFDQDTTGTFNGVMSDGKQSGGPNDPNDVSCTLVSCSGPTLSGTLIKDDSTTGSGGNVTIANQQAYSGMTYIEAGTLTLGAVDTIASSQGVTLGRVGGDVCNPAPCSGATAILALGANNTIQGLQDDAANTTQVQLDGHTLTLAPIAGSSWSYAGSIIDNGSSGSLVQNGPGMSILTGTSSYTGSTTIDAGVLEVNGSITSSSSVLVNSGGTLTGDGLVDPPTVTIASGGTFAPGLPGTPGTSMTIAGNLAFGSDALYLVQLNSSSSTFANVTGTVALGGSVFADFLPGTSPLRQYTILKSAGLSGSFSSVSTSFADFDPSLSTSGNNVLLNMTAALGAAPGLNTNQESAASTIDNFFNNGGTLPANFVSLYNLTGSGLTNALTQVDGEGSTDSERASFQMMTEFLGLVLDPSVDGRSGGPGGGAMGFAPDQEANLPPDVALAYASVFKAPPKQAFDQRWTAWGSGFVGSNQTNGDPIVGSNNVNTTTYGYVVGLDYHYSPDTVLGVALGGGGTNWDMSQSLGTGWSNAFQAGVYGVTHAGPAYLAAALAFSNNWFTTNRAALGDELTANFQGQGYGARVEGGYRFAVPVSASVIGVTPYAALQSQDFHTPSYSETDLTGGGFGLSYNAMNGTDTRGELGARFDNPTLLNGKPLILRAQLAWAHDWATNPALNASFENLPGTSFTVNGAPIPKDSALTSEEAEFWLNANWSLIAKFDGEFGSGSQTYAGSGTLQYKW